MVEYNFKGKRVLVTGAGRGFGREIAKTLVAEGAVVYALSRTRSTLDSLKKECPSITIICCDLEQLDESLEAVKPFLPFDYLVNNAGIVQKESFLETKQDTYDKIMLTNLKAPYFLSQLVAQSMVDNGIKGSIVHLSSRSSDTVVPDLHVYSISKAALDMLGKNMAAALGPHGIRVNCVNPTLVLTDMGKIAWTPEKGAELISTLPLGKLPEIHHVVDAVLFLLSDKSAMTTGATFPVDGGL